jgi:hypothetical protein
MAALPYKSVSWGDEPILKDKLNTMTNNDQWMFENMPRISYDAHSVRKTTGMKILAGKTLIPATSTNTIQIITYFNGYFSPGCNPIVTTGFNPTNGQNRYHVATYGLDGRLLTDHRGMLVTVSADEFSSEVRRITGPVWVNWIAVGW